MLDQEIQNMQQNETSFPPEPNLDLSLLSNESPMDTTQTEPTPGPSNGPRTIPKKGRKPNKKVTQGSKFDFRVCTICQTKVKKIGQHLDKMHPELEDVHRKFLMSFYRTHNARITVFQCVNCPLRLTNKRRHLQEFPGHIILTVKNKQSPAEFPPELTMLSETTSLGFKSSQILEEFDEYYVSTLGTEIRQFHRRFVKKVFQDTNQLKNLKDLGGIIRTYRESNNYTHSSMQKLLPTLKMFVKWMRRHKTRSHKVSYSTIFEEISAYEERNKVAGRKESKARQKSRFEGLPSMEELAKLAETIRKRLVHGVSNDFTYLDLASLSIFLVLIDNNCRLGTVLKTTTEDYDKVDVGAIIRSHEHKTGHVYENFFEKTEETNALISKCHELFTKETGLRKPKLLFPNKQGREMTTASANFNSALSKHFETPNFKVGPNIIRKVWETHIRDNASKIPEELQRAFRSNTGHSEATADRHYVAPLEDSAIRAVLKRQREIIRDAMYTSFSADSFEAEVDPSRCTDEPSTSAPKTTSSSTNQVDEASQSEQEEETAGDDTTADSVTLGTHTTSAEREDPMSNTESIASSMGTTMSLASLGTPRSRRNKLQIGRNLSECERWAEMIKRLQNFRGAEDPLRPTMKRVIAIISKERHRLTKNEMRELMKPLRITCREQEAVLEKVYKKYHNLCMKLNLKKTIF